MPVFLKLYTKETISDGLPDGTWEHRVLFDPETMTARVVEAYAVPEGLKPKIGAWTEATESDFDPEAYHRTSEQAKQLGLNSDPVPFPDFFLDNALRLFQIETDAKDTSTLGVLRLDNPSPDLLKELNNDHPETEEE